MQRRAAAAYFVLFMVISAGAYAYIGMAERPHVDVPGKTHIVGDEISVDGRTYTVDSIGKTGGGGGGGHGGGGGGEIVGKLTWTDPDATYTASLSNNSTVSWQAVSWEGQRVGNATIRNGTAVTFNGSEYVVDLNASADPPTVRLWKAGWPPAGVNASNATRPNSTFESGGTISLTLDGQPILGATITEVNSDSATLSWGSEYLVVIPKETDPNTAMLVQQQNVSRMLAMDPDVQDNLGEDPDGSPYVEYTNGTDVPLPEYLPDPEVKRLSDGDTLAYNGNVTTVNVTQKAIRLNWTGSKTFSVELSEGDSVDLNGQAPKGGYLVHFPDNESVQLTRNTTANYTNYQQDQHEINVYHERKAGLWGVTILSFLAGLILLSAAYLPVKD